MKLGYACINTNLQKKGIKINRGMIKRTFDEKGIDYALKLARNNILDLRRILHWNHRHGIKFYRMSSDMLPWGSEWFSPPYDKVPKLTMALLSDIGYLAAAIDHRLTFHPGPFCVLVSPRDNVVTNTIRDLNLHGFLMDAMGLARSPYNKINIHCNGVYGDKIKAMDRFCLNFEKLDDSVKTRLTVENDDKASMYSVKDLMYIHERIGIPIVFDYHHHTFNTGDLTEHEALALAVSTWPDGIIPVVHYSESKALHESNDSIKPQAHSDYIDQLPETYGFDVDIMVEAKQKEQALFKLNENIYATSN